MSAYIFVAVGGGSIGLLVGGILTQALNWHWIFFINVPIGVFTFVAGRILIVENVGLGIRTGVDVVGSVLITVSLMLGIYAISTATQYGWLSAHTLGFGGASVALLVAFFVLESRLANPIMPLRILRDPDAHPVERHPGDAGHGHVHHLLPRRPLPRGRPRLHPGPDGSGLPPDVGDHGDPVGRGHRPTGHPVRGQAGADPRHGRRARSGSCCSPRSAPTPATSR